MREFIYPNCLFDVETFVLFLIFIVFYFYPLLVAKLVSESLLLLLSLEFFYIYLRKNLFESMFHDILSHSLI